MKPKQILIIGGGLTGSILSSLLKRNFKDGVNICVWEKGRGCGGRMATSRCDTAPSLTLDLGAQYISATREYAVKHESYYKELLEANILTPLNTPIDGMKHADGTSHYVTPKGSASIPKYFMTQAGNPLRSSTLLRSIDVKDHVIIANGLSNDQDINQEVDAIILTIPVPQLFGLQGDIKNLLQPFEQNLSKVEYSSRYAYGLFYPGVNNLNDIPWSAKYVTDNTCLRYISVDTKKRQQEGSGTSVVVHTSVPFGKKHLEDSFSDAQHLIEDELFKYLPSLPRTDLKKILRWRYSQVSRAYEDTPGCLLISENPLIAVAGDAFVHSNFDGCVESAEAIMKLFDRNFFGKL